MQPETQHPPSTPLPHSLGRTDIKARLEQDVDEVRSGHGSTTVLRGAAGMGKSTLLGLAATAAHGMDVVRCRGIESEQLMPYAGLQLLCTTFQADPTGLDGPQAAAIDRALGRAEGEANPFLVGLATLSMVTAAVRRRPTLCLIDDAQWLDDESAATIAFVLRRLDTQPLCVLVATRATADDAFAELPDLRLTGLSDAEAQSLLRAASFGRIDELVLDRIVAEARGTPRILLDAIADMRSANFAGGYGVAPGPAPVPRTSTALAARLTDLDADERRFLLLAAAEPTGDPALVWRAAEKLGIDRRTAGTVQDLNWLRIGSHLLFSEPATRTEIYRAAPTGERNAVHQALAEATDPETGPERRTWHLACATTGLDDTLASELESHAIRARDRSGSAGAAAFLERSALLTHDVDLRAGRALAAAVARFDAGSAAGSAQMLATASLGRLDPESQGSFDRQQARLAFFAARGGPAAEQLLRVAQDLPQTDEQPACEAFLEALVAATFAGRLGPGVDVFANKMPPDWTVDALPRQLLDGLTARFAAGFGAGYRALAPVLREDSTPDDAADPNRRWLWLRSCIAADLWDDERWGQLAVHALDAAYETGSLACAPYALTSAAVTELHFGNLDAAQRLVDRIDALALSTQAPPFHCAALLLAGWRGDERAALALMDTARRDAHQRGEGIVLTTAALAAAVLYNGLGRYDAALDAANDAAARDELATFGWSVLEVIEAASRTGRHEAAGAVLAELTERTRTAGTDWALGIEARSRALLTEGPAAEPLYRESVERLSRTSVAVHHARAQLVYGEWLRRQGRRVEARRQLRTAWESLAAIGATAFAERARREYLATGGKLRRQDSSREGRLTPQEARIAMLAREGLTNPQIGARLYLSPRTVEYHLHKVFEKLNISSRRDLVHTDVARFDAEGTDRDDGELLDRS